MSPLEEPILFFDGHCNLCNRSVNFVMRFEREPVLRFASIGSATARHHFAEHSRLQDVDSLILLESGEFYIESDAALRSVRYLKWYMQFLRLGWLIPRPLRDRIYRYIASRRYQWFGRRELCRMPEPHEVSRFLN